MADIKNSFLGLPEFLFLQEEVNDSSTDLLTSCIVDTGCVDSLDCQSDGGSCTRDGCSDCDDCSDVVIPTSITITSLTSTSSTITATCYVVTQWGGSGLYVQLRLNGSVSFNSSTFTMGAGDSRSVTVTATGLSPQTYYSVDVYLYSQSGQIVGDSSSIKTEVAVNPWDWNISNGVATAAQTQKAHQALVNRGPTTDFSYLVWNDMVDKANEVVQARNHTWNTDYGTINETKASSVDKNITARRVNAVWWNMGQFITTGLSKKSPGDTITGQYFIDLANAINDAIPQGV